MKRKHPENEAELAQKVHPLYPKGMDFFRPASMNVAEETTYYKKVTTTFQKDTLPQRLTFYYPNRGRHYVDLARSQVYMKVRIVNEDRAPFTDFVTVNTPGEEDYAFPVDNLLHSCWKNVSLSLSGFLMSTTANTYPYKAFIEYSLGMSAEVKRNQGALQGASPDDQYFDDVKPPKIPVNRGAKYRWSWFDGGKSVEMMGKLYNDICNQKRYILNETPIELVFEPAPDEFRLMTTRDKKPRLLIEDMYLRICHVVPQPKVFRMIEERINDRELVANRAQYPHARVHVLNHQVNANLQQYIHSDPWNGKVPNKLIVGLVTQSALCGNYKKNPFNFNHHNLSSIALQVGNSDVPGEPIKSDVKNGQYLGGLISLYDVADKQFADIDMGIDSDTYKNGLCLYGFNIDPNAEEDEGTRGLPRRDMVTLTLNFSEPIQETLSLVTYAVFDELMTIDYSRVARLTGGQPQ